MPALRNGSRREEPLGGCHVSRQRKEKTQRAWGGLREGRKRARPRLVQRSWCCLCFDGLMRWVPLGRRAGRAGGGRGTDLGAGEAGVAVALALVELGGAALAVHEAEQRRVGGDAEGRTIPVPGPPLGREQHPSRRGAYPLPQHVLLPPGPPPP